MATAVRFAAAWIISFARYTVRATCAGHFEETLRAARVADEGEPVGVIRPPSHLTECALCVAQDRARWRDLPHGIKTYGDDDAGVAWAVFPRRWTDAAITRFLEARGWYTDGYRCHSGDYDCCGRLGARAAYIVRRGSRALARQSFYRDV